MLLLLTLVYLFHGFQIQAAPLTSLADSSFGNLNTAVASTASQCVCPADQRSLWDILWSCLATIFACSWVSVHPNIPGPDEPWWRVFLRRLELMFWAVFGPELLIAFAFRQWSGARHLEKLYKDRGWTKTHGYFIQMGGFMLFYGEDAMGVLSPQQFSELLEAKKIDFPSITEEEIEDRSKADGFSKTIALGQTLWFVAQCLARRAEHVDMTLVELLTLSLAALNGLMYFLWWNKPLDVRCPVRVYLHDKPNEGNAVPDTENFDHFAYSYLKSSFSNVSSYISKKEPQLFITWQSHPLLGKALILIGSIVAIPVLLAFALPIIALSLFFMLFFLFPVYRWLAMLSSRVCSIGDMKVSTFYSFEWEGGETVPAILILVLVPFTGVVFGGIHCAGWFFVFPSDDEGNLWRVCSAIVTGTAFLLPLYPFVIAFLPESLHLVTTFFLMLGFGAYILSRLLLLVEAIISLRHLTPGLLAVVKWTSFIPHI